MAQVQLHVLEIGNEKTHEIIIGQGNFSVKTIDELYTLVYSCEPKAKIGIAMNEAKPRLVRVVGNDEEAKQAAAKTALQISAGHVFVVFLKDAYPIQVINSIKSHPCVVGLYCATSNPLKLLVARDGDFSSVLGVFDGTSSTAIETEEQKAERREMVKKFGFLPK